MLFVAAATNFGENSDVTPRYPASYDVPRIIAVAGTDRNDALGWSSSAYASNYGPASVDLAAPGWDIVSTVKPLDYYGSMSGTSMAAPHVTGTAALIFGNPATSSLNPDQVKARILASVDFLPSLFGKVLTNGRLNTLKAVTGSSDVIAPSAISITVEYGRTSAAISWTAPGDDFSTGTASGFDLRVSSQPITSSNFYTCAQVATPTPGPPGTPHCAIATGLNSCNTYYFAIKTRDEVYNWSAMSGVVSGSTTCSGAEAACGITQPQLQARNERDPSALEVGTPDNVELSTRAWEPGSLSQVVRYGLPPQFAGLDHELAAFDIAGRRVRTLASGPVVPGRFSVEWDLRSDEAGRLPPGVYLVRLRVGDTFVSRKIVNVR